MPSLSRGPFFRLAVIATQQSTGRLENILQPDLPADLPHVAGWRSVLLVLFFGPILVPDELRLAVVAGAAFTQRRFSRAAKR